MHVGGMTHPALAVALWRSCLHLAASEGNVSVVASLLEAAADLNTRDRWGGTPLRDAVRHGHMEVARALRAKGGEMGFDEVEASGQLCELARSGSFDLLTIMLTCGVHVNAADYDMRTCLHLAASEVRTNESSAASHFASRLHAYSSRPYVHVVRPYIRACVLPSVANSMPASPTTG